MAGFDGFSEEERRQAIRDTAELRVYKQQPGVFRVDEYSRMLTMSDPETQKRIYVTLSGLPISIKLEWPFHQSTSGADFWVLHADIRLESAPLLHAPVSVNMSATVREVMPSLEAKDAEAPVINSLRKEIDRRQIEFLKSGKLVPLNFSSRHYDFKRQRWVFGKASEADIDLLVRRKVYWQTKGGGRTVWLGDPTEALYLETTTGHVLEVGRRLAEEGLLTLEGEYASANASLMALAERFEADAQAALEELEKKHAFERG